MLQLFCMNKNSKKSCKRNHSIVPSDVAQFPDKSKPKAIYDKAEHEPPFILGNPNISF